MAASPTKLYGFWAKDHYTSNIFISLVIKRELTQN